MNCERCHGRGFLDELPGTKWLGGDLLTGHRLMRICPDCDRWLPDMILALRKQGKLLIEIKYMLLPFHQRWAADRYKRFDPMI